MSWQACFDTSFSDVICYWEFAERGWSQQKSTLASVHTLHSFFLFISQIVQHLVFPLWKVPRKHCSHVFILGDSNTSYLVHIREVTMPLGYKKSPQAIKKSHVIPPSALPVLHSLYCHVVISYLLFFLSSCTSEALLLPPFIMHCQDLTTSHFIMWPKDPVTFLLCNFFLKPHVIYKYLIC